MSSFPVSSTPLFFLANILVLPLYLGLLYANWSVAQPGVMDEIVTGLLQNRPRRNLM
ncbi:MAG TPA: hypothetical protein V6D20_11650 [Candidatus Obscuribacterales bacterium]